MFSLSLASCQKNINYVFTISSYSPHSLLSLASCLLLLRIELLCFAGLSSPQIANRQSLIHVHARHIPPGHHYAWNSFKCLTCFSLFLLLPRVFYYSLWSILIDAGLVQSYSIFLSNLVEGDKLGWSICTGWLIQVCSCPVGMCSVAKLLLIDFLVLQL